MNTKGKILNAVIISVLILILGVVGSLFYNTKSELNDEKQKLSEVDSIRMDVQVKYDSAVIKLDDLAMSNDNLQTQNSRLQDEINSIKVKIKKTIRKDKVTKNELLKAKKLIKNLNAKILDYEREIAQLKRENRVMHEKNQELTMQNNQLVKALNETRAAKEISDNKVDIGSTLTVSNVSAQALNKRDNKTKIAEKAHKLKITFTVNENRISESTEKVFYLVMTNPLGDVANGKTNVDVLSTKTDGQKQYTGKVKVDYKTGMISNVTFVVDFDNIQVDGVHKIELYENGYKISESKVLLKKRKFLGFI